MLFSRCSTKLLLKIYFSFIKIQYILKPLNLPYFDFKRRKLPENREEIFDIYRKKWVKLTPEEWVRQNFLKFLTEVKNYPTGLVTVERSLKVNRMYKRFDAVVYDRKSKVQILLEFKSHEIKLSQNVFDQIAAYNTTINAKYLIVSNGLKHFCCIMDYANNRYTFLKDIPEYSKL